MTTPTDPPMPGDIYWSITNGGNPRPVIVVSRQELNRGEYIVAVPVTSTRLEQRWTLPNCVTFKAGEFGFRVNCVVQVESITLFEKTELDLYNGPLERLDDERMREVVRAIGYVISADCEPE